MKIIQIVPSLISGGAERFTVDLSNQFAEMGHEVILLVFASHPDQNFYLPEVSSKVRVITFGKKPGFDFKLFFKLYRIVKYEKPDVVQTHLYCLDYMPICLMLNNSVKYFHVIHNDAFQESQRLLSSIIRKWCFRTKKVCAVTISEESLKSFVEMYGISAPLIYNGRKVPSVVNTDSVCNEITKFLKSERTRVIAHVASVRPWKRQDLMARVSKRLEDEGFDFTVLFIGRENHDPDFLRKVKKVYCSSCHILGEKRNPLEYLKIADGFALCSEYEGMPISLLEAMAMGAVPVCTPVGGIVNVVKDGENGILSNTIDESDYYEALKRFLSLSVEELNIMKSKAIESFRPYSIENCATKYLELYDEV